jgi:hypothetical protein
VVTIYYTNDEETGPERYIGATIWDPGRVSRVTDIDPERQAGF